jgi:hypothetical protein
MRDQEIVGLWESYLQVCGNHQLDEVSKELAGRVVNARIAKTGAAFDREMKDRTPENMRDTMDAADKESRSKKLAAGVRTRRNVTNEEVDIFDIILEYLVDEGYADTNGSALAIMANMSEEWKEDIMEISQKTAITAYARRSSNEFEGDDGPDRVRKNNELHGRIVKKFGDKSGEDANKAADANTFGRTDSRTGKRQERPKSRIEKNRTYRTTKAGKMHGQDKEKLKSDLIKRRNRG